MTVDYYVCIVSPVLYWLESMLISVSLTVVHRMESVLISVSLTVVHRVESYTGWSQC